MNTLKSPINLIFILLITSASGTVWGHTGSHAADAFASGFVHPLLGVDHLAMMLGVGLWASVQAVQTARIVMTGFLAAMLIGSLLPFYGFSMPPLETGIALSVIAAAILIHWRYIRLPTPTAILLFGLLALLHGFAHGMEIPAAASPSGYALGFLLATATLLNTGLLLGYCARRYEVEYLITACSLLTGMFGSWVLLA